MILSAYGSAAAFSADRINAPKERPTLRQMKRPAALRRNIAEAVRLLSESKIGGG